LTDFGKGKNSFRVLVLAPTRRDSEITASIFAGENIASVACSCLEEFCAQLQQGAGAGILTEEVLAADKSDQLQKTLLDQPQWSDFPLLVLTPVGGLSFEAKLNLEAIGHMTLIKRPVQVAELLSAIRAALRDRERQYAVHTYLVELETEKKKAEAANKAKSEFLANMSHEIRTPMHVITGLAQILAVSQPLTPKQRDYVKTLQTSAKSLLILINDLLDISKIESQAIEIEKIPFSLFSLLAEIEDTTVVEARRKSLNFITTISIAPQLIVYGDPTRLRQILSNLCSNAVKFTDKGRVVLRVTADNGDSDENCVVSFHVEDTGTGISPQKIDAIFEKFVQEDSSITRTHGGSGLGLAIAKTLAEIMGGSISVKSELGSGSVFSLRLPFAIAPDQRAAEEQPTTAIPAEPVAIHAGHILLVEDYQPNVLVAGILLEEFGYSYDVASNGELAVQKIAAKNYDAILMDVQMPRMNGLEATRLIRNIERQQDRPHQPIIGMTAHAFSGDRARCMESGMDDYICKPFSADELQTKLKTLVHS